MYELMEMIGEFINDWLKDPAVEEFTAKDCLVELEDRMNEFFTEYLLVKVYAREEGN